MKVHYITALGIVLCNFIGASKVNDSCTGVVAPVEKKCIIASVSTPRSLSTALMRLFSARGDFVVINEPGIYFYGLKQGDPIAYIDKVLQQDNVFLKEISSPKNSLLLTQEGCNLFKQKNVYTIFLVRDPHHTIISFFNKSERFLKTQFYEKLYEALHFLTREAANKPVILFSEDLYNRPEVVYQALCSYSGIPYIAEALSWQSLDEETAQKTWSNAARSSSMFHRWHEDAVKSTCIHKPRVYEVDKDNLPTFSEIPENRRITAHGVYKECVRWYDAIKQEFKQYFLLPE